MFLGVLEGEEVVGFPFFEEGVDFVLDGLYGSFLGDVVDSGSYEGGYE